MHVMNDSAREMHVMNDSAREMHVMNDSAREMHVSDKQEDCNSNTSITYLLLCAYSCTFARHLYGKREDCAPLSKCLGVQG